MDRADDILLPAVVNGCVRELFFQGLRGITGITGLR
jgi:hypothetical protein